MRLIPLTILNLEPRAPSLRTAAGPAYPVSDGCVRWYTQGGTVVYIPGRCTLLYPGGVYTRVYLSPTGGIYPGVPLSHRWYIPGCL